MKNKLISSACVFGLIFSAFGGPMTMNEGNGNKEDKKLQFEEINQPEYQPKEFFSLNDLFSNLNSFGRNQKKTLNEKKDYFAEDPQAFAEDDPWDAQ